MVYERNMLMAPISVLIFSFILFLRRLYIVRFVSCSDAIAFFRLITKKDNTLIKEWCEI